MVDESSTLLQLKGNTFTGGQIGAAKNYGGQLNFRCNSFDNVYAPIYAANLSTINLSNFSNNLGYNQFTNAYISSIIFNNADIPFLAKGYNNFYSGSVNAPFFSGDINVAGFSALEANNNEWNNSLSIPGQNRFQVSNNSIQVSVNTSPTQSATCGQHDVNTNSIPYIGAEPLSAVISFSTTTGSITGPANQLLGIAMESSRVIDSANGNNSESLEMLHGLMLYDYSTTNASESTIKSFLDYTLKQMKFTLQSTFEYGEVTEEDNITTFHPFVQKYVDGLNKKSSYIQVQDNKAGLVSHELDKVMLYDLIGQKQTALSMLYNMQSCGLDSIDQVIVNKYIFGIESSKLHINLGYESYLNDTIFVDTTAYYTPTNENTNDYLFSTTINSLSNIDYTTGCEPESEKQSVENENNIPNVLDLEGVYPIEVYPNPGHHFVTFKYQVQTNDQAKVWLYNLDGQLVLKQNLSNQTREASIDIRNLSTGLYLYKYRVNGNAVKTGKLTKQ